MTTKTESHTKGLLVADAKGTIACSLYVDNGRELLECCPFQTTAEFWCIHLYPSSGLPVCHANLDIPRVPTSLRRNPRHCHPSRARAVDCPLAVPVRVASRIGSSVTSETRGICAPSPPWVGRYSTRKVRWHNLIVVIFIVKPSLKNFIQIL